MLDHLAGKDYRFVRLDELLDGEESKQEIFLRASQVGYAPTDEKVAVAFSKAPLPESFTVVDAESGASIFTGKAGSLPGERWGAFEHHAELDFTPLARPGRYVLRLGDARSLPFTLGESVLAELPDQLLEFMRQQRCGYNPWLGVKCHQHDGRTAYGPRPAGTPVDAVGGWHDAGDLLKYHMTSGNATAQMLLAYILAGGNTTGGSHLADRVDAGGDPETKRRARPTRRGPLGPGVDAQAPPRRRRALPPGGRRPRSYRLPIAPE